MCAAAAALFRVRRVIFGAYDPKGGGIAHNARVYERPGSLAVPEVVGGVRETECGTLLRQFFLKKR
jgi:tRNA(Arg) A34 adenosine deaminase TadA